jgi:MFS family permease
VLSPLAVILLPGVAWAAYCYATAVALSIAISVSLSSIFSAAPYHFKTSQIGLTVLSAAVGDLIGNLVPGPISDWIVLSMSRRNKGVYEPEFRILLVIPAFFIGLAGYWGFGLSIYYRTHWFGPVFCFGLSALAGQVVSLISNTYLLDCHRKFAQDAYAVVTLFKGVLTFAAAFFISNWLQKSGIVQVFFLIGMIHGIACVWGLVLYVYGKRVSFAVTYIRHRMNSLTSRDRFVWQCTTAHLSITQSGSVVIGISRQLEWYSTVESLFPVRIMDHRRELSK